jgi:hypothetical protein
MMRWLASSTLSKKVDYKTPFFKFCVCYRELVRSVTLIVFAISIQGSEDHFTLIISTTHLITTYFKSNNLEWNYSEKFFNYQ